MNETDDLILLLKEALPYLQEHTDMGPLDDGWKSDELSDLITNIQRITS